MLTLQVSSGMLSGEALGRALEFASLAASIACTRAGANPPFSAEISRARGDVSRDS
jgi:sugar/nucleoside kinase (ribokinase family)